jgi:transcriptional regulator with XRE-family HTH domain
MSGAAPPASISLRRLLSRKVRRRRVKLKLTLETASERSGIYWRHWQKIEAGEANVTLETLARLARALDVHVYVLLRPVKLLQGAALRRHHHRHRRAREDEE